MGVEIYRRGFIFCILYVVIMFLLGGIFDGLNLDGADLPNDLLANIMHINGTCVMAFLTVFNGVGMYLSEKHFKWYYTLIISTILGLATSKTIDKYIIKPLKKIEESFDMKTENLIGKEAVVTTTIYENGFGRISYVYNGVKMNSPAKEIDLKQLEVNTLVRIKKIENQVFYVEKL